MIATQLYSVVIKTILRFPLAISGFVGFFIIAMHIDGCCEFWENLDNAALETIFPFLAIEFFLMFAVELYSERKKINSAFLALPIILALWAYFFYLSSSIREFGNDWANQVSLSGFASVSLAVIALFTGKGFLNWQYSKKIVGRLIFAIFIVLFLYEALALLFRVAAVPMYVYLNFLYSYLPDIGENYSWIATLIAATVGALFFLSGIPKIPKKLRTPHPI